MKLPLSDLLDRYSIEMRKDFYGHGNRQLIEALQREIRAWVSEWLDKVTNGGIQADCLSGTDVFPIIHAAVLLGIRNADIANLEWQLRAKDHKITLEEHGRRALAIRIINDGRNQAKKDLSDALGENAETKHYGYGGLIQAEQITKDVQPVANYITQGFEVWNDRPPIPTDETRHTFNCPNCGSVLRTCIPLPLEGRSRHESKCQKCGAHVSFETDSYKEPSVPTK